MSLHASQLFDLTGKVALVTGGGTGIGLTAALALASNGATVYISGRRKDKLDDAVNHYSSSVGKGKLIAYVQPSFPLHPFPSSFSGDLADFVYDFVCVLVEFRGMYRPRRTSLRSHPRSSLLLGSCTSLLTMLVLKVP